MRGRGKHKAGFALAMGCFVALGAANLAALPGLARGTLQRHGYQNARVGGLKLLAPLCTNGTGGVGFTATRHGHVAHGYVCASVVYSYVVEQ